MAFKQYTSCVQPGDYIDLSGTAIGFRNIGILFSSGMFAAWFASVILGGPAAIVVAIALFTEIVLYLHWWLHGRLICLGGEQCYIGVVAGAGPAQPVEKAGDNDYSMNVLIAPGPTNYVEDKTVYWNTPPRGHLVAENPDILGIGRGYVQDAGHKSYVTSLHSEFEGDGIAKMLMWAKIILGVLIAALAAWLFLPPILSGLLFILAIILTLAGLGETLVPPNAPGAGDPTDVDPALGELRRGHVVVVKGEWVYDSLHHGWNEMHPIRACMILGEMQLPGSSFSDLNNPALPPTPWPTDLQGEDLSTETGVQAALDRWCAALEDADDTVTGGSQDDPQNGWVIHPLIDGCKPPIIIE